MVIAGLVGRWPPTARDSSRGANAVAGPAMTQVVTAPIRPPAAVRAACWLAAASILAGVVSAVLIFFDVDLLAGGRGDAGIAYGSAVFALVSARRAARPTSPNSTVPGS
jgi:hypothetical protein